MRLANTKKQTFRKFERTLAQRGTTMMAVEDLISALEQAGNVIRTSMNLRNTKGYSSMAIRYGNSP